ncbi:MULTISPECIES: hypothetical protein [Bacillus]|uniref:hypothetical protein n=1 Tax=Bacillus TaxID=1386 RepID=UPI00203BDBC5|nr:hypothetical protein [Bacillus velezensis]MCM3447568.1 hypothetical protein [Bacillus velezensis]
MRNIYLIPMPPGFRPHTKERSETRHDYIDCPDVFRFGEGKVTVSAAKSGVTALIRDGPRRIRQT